MKKICIFTGAGISVPLGLPATDGFTKTIERIEPSLLAQIKSFHHGRDANDIEKILYLLEDFVREKSFVQHIIKQNLKDDRFQIVHDNIAAYTRMAKDAIEVIKAEIFDLLQKYDDSMAKKLYSSMIIEIQSFFDESAISFFTANYDLTFEDGFADDEQAMRTLGIDSVYYGFGGGRNGSNPYNPAEDFNWDPRIIEYKKLHGSLDWNKYKNRCFKNGNAGAPRNASQMPMLYPGFKGIPSEQPFIDLHEKFDKRINEADLMFVLGFAFRDDYINNIFDYGMKRNPNLIVLCYNPCKNEDYPDDSKMKYFKERYPMNFFHIEKPVIVTDAPLALSEILNLTKIKSRMEFLATPKSFGTRV